MSTDHKQHVREESDDPARVRASTASLLVAKLLRKRLGTKSLLRPKVQDRREVFRCADLFLARYGRAWAHSLLRRVKERHGRVGDWYTVAYAEDVIEAIERLAQSGPEAPRWRT